MDLQGKTVASTFQFLLNQSGANPITLGNGDAVDWASAGVVTTLNISSSATTAVTAGSGLAGGGTVGSLTLNVGSGDGITVNADNISVNSTVVRTTGAQTIGGTKTFDSAIQGITTGANALTTSRTINGTSFNGTSDITTSNWGTSRNISIGGTSKSVNGSANYTWSESQISANTAVTLKTSRNLWGRSFNGSADVTGSLTGVGDITFGTSTNKITATVSTPSANRTYTIPDVGGNASFVMTTGNQDIGGTKEFKTRPTVNGTGVLLQGEAGGGGGGISTVTAGSGLAGGGSSSTVTLDVGQGDGIIVSEDDIAVDSTVVRTTATNQTIGGIKTFQNQIINAANANSHLAANSYIAAGQNNLIEIGCLNSFIGAGAENQILGNSQYSVICGGGQYDSAQNLISNCAFSFIGGGSFNALYEGGYNTLCGGYENESYGSFNIIGGGLGHAVGKFVTQVAYSAVLGGNKNKIFSDYSVIAGGTQNFISGDSDYSSIVGGRKANIATGHSGAGVWADGQDRDHNSKGAHTLSLDFASGVYLRLPQFTGSSNQNGNFGELKVSGSGLYVCTGTNGSGWGRIFLSTF